MLTHIRLTVAFMDCGVTTTQLFKNFDLFLGWTGLDGIEPDGRLSITEEFRAQILTLAKQILPQLSD